MKPKPKPATGDGQGGMVFLHLSQSDHFKQMTQSKFTLSPPGNTVITNVFQSNQ